MLLSQKLHLHSLQTTAQTIGLYIHYIFITCQCWSAAAIIVYYTRDAKIPSSSFGVVTFFFVHKLFIGISRTRRFIE